MRLRVLITAVAAVVVLSFLWAACGTNGDPAGASVRRVGHPFTAQAHRVPTPRRLVSPGGSSPTCWAIEQTWRRYDLGPPHKVKWAPTSYGLWCSRHGRIVRFPTHQCWSSGGTWHYNPPCAIQPGGTGFESVPSGHHVELFMGIGHRTGDTRPIPTSSSNCTPTVASPARFIGSSS